MSLRRNTHQTKLCVSWQNVIRGSQEPNPVFPLGPVLYSRIQGSELPFRIQVPWVIRVDHSYFSSVTSWVLRHLFLMPFTNSHHTSNHLVSFQEHKDLLTSLSMKLNLYCCDWRENRCKLRPHNWQRGMPGIIMMVLIPGAAGGRKLTISLRGRAQEGLSNGQQGQQL